MTFCNRSQFSYFDDDETVINCCGRTLKCDIKQEPCGSAMHDEQLNVVITAWRKFTQKLFLKSHHADFYFRFSIDEHLFILNIVPRRNNDVSTFHHYYNCYYCCWYRQFVDLKNSRKVAFVIYALFCYPRPQI